MTAPAGNSSSWQIAGVIVTAIVGVTAVFQSQISALRDQTETQFSAQGAAVEQLRKTNEADTIRLALELTRRESDLKAQMRSMQDELDRRRGEFVYGSVFDQFSHRMISELSIIKEQLKIIEQTRPTTGELGAIGKSIGEQVGRIEERLRQIEQNVLRGTKP